MKPQPSDSGHTARYGYGRTLDLPFPRALERARTALQSEGFGVLFEIDLRGKLQEKLGVHHCHCRACLQLRPDAL